MRFFKNRLFISGLCMALSGVLAFVILPGLYADKSATTTIVTVNEPIAAGTQLDEKMLAEATVGAYGLPAAVIKDKKQLIGKYVQTDLYKGDLMLPEKISEYQADATLDALMKAGQRLVTVSLPSMASGLSSHLQKGDIVSVVSYIPETTQQSMDGYSTQPGRVVLYPELQQLKVYDIENAKTESVETVKEEKERSNPLSDDPVPKTVTLITSEAQALKLIEAEYTGKIHLIFVKRGGN